MSGPSRGRPPQSIMLDRLRPLTRFSFPTGVNQGFGREEMQYAVTVQIHFID